MQFSDYIGKEMHMVITTLDPTAMHLVTIRGAEAGGIWIECAAMVLPLLRGTTQAGALASPIFFLPYNAIGLAVVHGGGTVLDEKALGL